MEREVIARAWAKATGEKTTGDEVRSGASAREAWAGDRLLDKDEL